MFPATLYKLSKKENSTLKPSAQTPSLPIAIDINDGDSSILSPSIRIPTNQAGLAQNANVFDYNYIYIGQFSRYYYVNNWMFNGDGTWTADCSVDVLATYKTDIMNSPGYIGRAESTYDPTIQDRFYYGRNEPVTIRDVSNTYFDTAPNDGIIVLGVATATSATMSPSTLGGVQYYALTMVEFCSLVQNLLGIKDAQLNLVNPDWVNQLNSTFKGDVWQSLNNPISYVVSCRFYPGKIFGNTYTTNEPIVFGGWKAGGAGGKKITNLLNVNYPWQPTGGVFTGQIKFSAIEDVAPATPIGAYYDDRHYPPYSPYASYILQTPWGEFPLDANIMADINRKAKENSPRSTAYLYWNMVINIVTGMGTFIVSDRYDTPSNVLTPSTSLTYTRHELIRTEVKVGTDIPLMMMYTDEKYALNSAAKIGSSFFDIFSAAASALGSYMGGKAGGNQGNALGGVMQSGVQGIKSTAQLGFDIADACIGTQKTAMGSNIADGNCTVLVSKFIVQQTRYPTVGQSIHMFGRPCKVQVSNLNNFDGNNTPFSGFIQMDYTEFNAVCTDTERASVIQYLIGGIFLE